jgi:hypothetical protein
MPPAKKAIFKRIRRGAFECGGYLLVRTHWLNDRWDGDKNQFRPWKVYVEASRIERRILLDGFMTRTEAMRFVEGRLRPSEADGSDPD